VGLSVWGMASSATTKAARRAAREAVVAAQADLARRNRANMDDLAVFLSARHRADAVDDWFKDRVAVLKCKPANAGPASCANAVWRCAR
jgi:hypothetical protein